MASCKPILLACKIFESKQGIEKKNPIIFLHGLGASKEHWVDIPQKVADATHRRVYAIDARNHGDSEWNEEFNFDINSVDLIHFIEQIAAEKVIIVGHSMGGITSMKTALKVPSKIEKMIIEDMGTFIPKEIKGSIKLMFSFHQDALSNIPKGLTLKEAAKFMIEFVYERLPDEMKPFIKRDNYERYSQMLKQNPDGSYTTRSNIKVLRKAIENDDTLMSEYKGLFDGPACFIYGEKSMFPVKQDAENIKKFFPNAQFVGIEEATHDVHSEEPTLYTAALLKFLKE